MDEELSHTTLEEIFVPELELENIKIIVNELPFPIE